MSQLRILVLLTLLTAGVAMANPIGRHPQFPLVLDLLWYAQGTAPGKPWVEVELHSNGDTIITRGKVHGHSDFSHNGLLSAAQMRDLVQSVQDADLQSGWTLANSSRYKQEDAPFMDLKINSRSTGAGTVRVQVQDPASTSGAAWGIARKLLQYADPKDLP